MLEEIRSYVEIFVGGFKVKLEKDTPYRGLWIVPLS